ncbi:CRISPR-associated protein Cas1 [Rhodopirellula rubra]|uniref:CRISPR-associated endonuclease Cas1 n=1 Tax=Aporhodopirellula rubra TaxID=980271 RepID=A0A7W5H6L2_9BACT|nr:type II CRISPR-associated endonuclease Cas1 [Aporhodopirellula rubra]MBB3207443.1 CRISPR-associated protein Cas1 [Aporhodopirellula rubra]
MLKRTIEISSQPTHLSMRHGQVTLSRDGELIGSVPCEDVGTVVVDHPQTTYTHAVLRDIVVQGGSVVICGHDHQPAGVLIPLGSHCQIVQRTREQIEATLPTKKRIWQQLIRGKILEASKVLDKSDAGKRLRVLVNQVRSGDPTNVEARAAKLFWQAWLPKEFAFRRDHDGDEFNGLLNYGYAIVRALISRAIVSAGYTPAIGIHHHHRGNPFCLSDDLIEPLRPLIDGCVRNLFLAGHREIDRESKTQLLGLLDSTTEFDGEHGPLNVVVHRYVNQFGACLRGETKTLDYPKRASSWN